MQLELYYPSFDVIGKYLRGENLGTDKRCIISYPVRTAFIDNTSKITMSIFERFMVGGDL